MIKAQISCAVASKAPNDTAYKRWGCHSGLKLLCKLCRTSPPPAMGPDLPFFGHAGHADPLNGWRCCAQKRVIQIQNPFLTAQSTQIKSVISVPIKDFIHHYPRALFNDIPMVGAHFYDIPGSGRTFTTYPGRDALLRHTRVGAQFNDIPGSTQKRVMSRPIQVRQL